MKFRFILPYALALGLIMIVLRFTSIRYTLYQLEVEYFSLVLALIFTGLGVFIAGFLPKSKQAESVAEYSVYGQIDPEAPRRFGISRREMEVLELLSKGLSNDEIGDRLCVSLPTIKSHVSRIYVKLDVNRRVRAVEKARNLRLIQ